MAPFLLCLLLTFVIALGGRDQVIVARLADTLERSWPLFLIGAVCAVISAGVMAWAGATIAQIMPPRAGQMLVAFALALAAVELAWPVRLRRMDEPTRSLGAIGFVLLARQLGDGARFVIFAFATAATYPVTAWLGGAIGGIAAIALGWMMGRDLEAKVPLRWVRMGLAVCLFVAALFIGLNARYPYL
jgi:putative Ca2+/H+ antiporter (TMEM165/GDT1 family)